MNSANVIGAAVVSRNTAATTTTVIITSTTSSVASSTPVLPTACPATYTCPENNGCTVRGSNAQTYVLSCATDYYGGDLTSMSTDSLQTCAKACTDNSQCVAASYVGGKGAGTCYLKSTNNGASSNGNVDCMSQLYDS